MKKFIWVITSPLLILLAQIMWHYSLCHPTLDTLKKAKFQLSRNSTKFDWVIRFHETIPTVKFVSSSDI